MHHASPLLLLTIVATFACACQSDPSSNERAEPDPVVSSDTQGQRPVAYLDGNVVTQAQLYRQVVPAHGGSALAEILLDRAVTARLAQEDIRLKPNDIEAEKQTLLDALASDPDQAARLLLEMRGQRGLDAARFDGLLRRNAGLRALIRDQVTVNEAAIQQAYELRYGERYSARLIVADRLVDLNRVRKQALEGQSFVALAIEKSTDASARQGGLLSPISPVDSTYPKAIRDALLRLKMDATASRLSPVIAIDQGYALLWLEEVIASDNPPPLDAVRAEIEADVRLDLERIRMRQLARTLIDRTNVIVLDPALNESWQRQQNAIQTP